MKTKVLKNGRSKLIAINGDVLKQVIADKGFNATELSDMMGFSSSYIIKCCNKNLLGEKCIQMLAERYNIKPAQYEADYEVSAIRQKLIKQSGVAKDVSIDVKVTFDVVQLKRLIKQAVKEAYEEL